MVAVWTEQDFYLSSSKSLLFPVVPLLLVTASTSQFDFWTEWHTGIPWHSSGKWIMHTLRMLSSLMAGCLLQREKAGTCVTGHPQLYCFMI